MSLPKLNIPWSRIGTAISSLDKKQPLVVPKSVFSASEVSALEQKYADEYKHTPDWMQLERHEYAAVFLYCNVMKGGSRHTIIENIYRIKDDDGNSANPYAFTLNRFEAWQTRDGRLSTPVALTSDASPLRLIPEMAHVPCTGKIKGRIFFIRSDQMKTLDAEKQNGVLFQRQKVKIQIPYRLQITNPIEGFESYTTGHTLTEERAHIVKVWMYIGIPDYWNNVPMHSLERCGTTYRTKIRKKFIYPVPPKMWMPDAPYYYFNAWEIANK